MPAGGCKPNVDHRKIRMLQELAAVQTPEQCQLWPGTIDTKGYGRIWYQGRWRLAHDAMWEVIKGEPLAAHLTLDHWQMNLDPPACSKACVNLFHLDPVPGVVNTLRGRGITAMQARQTHCKRGHEFTAENTYLTSSGGRDCRECMRRRGRIKMRSWRAARKEQR